jgi:hypothetical protein
VPVEDGVGCQYCVRICGGQEATHSYS